MNRNKIVKPWFKEETESEALKRISLSGKTIAYINTYVLNHNPPPMYFYEVHIYVDDSIGVDIGDNQWLIKKNFPSIADAQKWADEKLYKLGYELMPENLIIME